MSTDDSSWSCVSTATWIRITKTSNKVTYEVKNNESTSSRTGTIMLFTSNGPSGTFTITQAGMTTSTTPKGNARTGSFSVPAQDGNWYAVATAPWIRVTKVGNYTVKYELTENESSSSRSGEVLVIGNQGVFYQYTITQEGK